MMADQPKTAEYVKLVERGCDLTARALAAPEEFWHDESLPEDVRAVMAVARVAVQLGSLYGGTSVTNTLGGIRISAHLIEKIFPDDDTQG
jgi:hypothetical protein